MKRPKWFFTSAVFLAASLGFMVGPSYGWSWGEGQKNLENTGSQVVQDAQRGADAAKQGAQNVIKTGTDLANAAANGDMGKANEIASGITNGAVPGAGAITDFTKWAGEQAGTIFKCDKNLFECAVDLFNRFKDSAPNMTPADVEAAMRRVAALSGTVRDSSGNPIPAVILNLEKAEVTGDISDACRIALSIAYGLEGGANFQLGSIKAGFSIGPVGGIKGVSGPDGVYQIPVPSCAAIKYTVTPGGLPPATLFAWTPGSRDVTVGTGGGTASQAGGGNGGGGFAPDSYLVPPDEQTSTGSGIPAPSDWGSLPPPPPGAAAENNKPATGTQQQQQQSPRPQKAVSGSGGGAKKIKK